MIPDTIGPYRVGRRLGGGAMGEVYLATDTRLLRDVAIKALLTNPARDTGHLHRALLREARAAASLSHPSIATVFDVIEKEDQVFLVMEYVPGETLAARIKNGSLPPALTVRFATDIADALACAHRSGIYHCDLKPRNIIVTPAGTVKILDFGLARSVVPAPDDATVEYESAGTGAVRGTPPYMAPEVLSGGVADSRSDIYSLGVTMYEMCCGQRPFDAPDLLSLATLVMSHAPPPLSARSPDVPRELEQVIDRAMARDARDRYQSADDLHQALQGVMLRDGEAVTQTAPGLPAAAPSTPGGTSRRPRLIAGGAAVALAAVVVAFIWVISRRDTPAASPSAPAVVAIAPESEASGDRQVLAAGFADVLLDELSALSDLVVARLPRPRCRRPGPTLGDVARSRGASHLVVPTVAETAGSVRLKVELRAASPDQLLWAHTVSGPIADIFDLQRQLSAALISALRHRGLVSNTLRPAPHVSQERTTTNVEAYAEYSQGRAFESRKDVPGNLERAAGLFERAIVRDPAFAQAHAALGRVSLDLHNQQQGAQWIDRARRELLEALRLAPESPTTRYSLAALYADTGQADIARQELERVVARDPENDDAHRLLGRLLVEAGKPNEGLAHLQTARRLRPEYWDNHRALGLAYFDTGRLPEAIGAFQRFTELQPDSAWGFQTLGTAYHASGDRARALDNYRKAIAIAPTATAHANIGTLLYEDGRFEEAVGAYDRALALRPRNPMTHRNRGDALLRLKRTPQAAASYAQCVELTQQALAVNPTSAGSLSLQAYCQARRGDPKAAVALMARAAALAPADNQVLFEQAVVFALAQRPCDALASLAGRFRRATAWRSRPVTTTFVPWRGIPNTSS